MVRVRFAPSPTGALHVGGARTALFNWLFARNQKGTFILRIEDSDFQRSTKEAEETILQGMLWLGLNWDEGPYRQSERLEIYRKYAKKLVDEGKGYEEKGALIFEVPPGETSFKDIVWGEIKIKNETLKDIVMIKSDGTPTYNFAVVVDDHEMGITHVIRGEDHIANTPKQILIYKAFDWEPPQFAHLPMILGPDKSKLSKRHGATSVAEYKNLGFLSDAFFNYLALLGWNPGFDQEIFSREELIELFSLDRVIKRGAVFDIKKLEWMNAQYIKKTPGEKLLELVMPFWKNKGLINDDHSLDREYLVKVIEIVKGRCKTLVDLADFTDYFLQKEITYDKILLDQEVKGKENLLSEIAERLEKLEPFETKNIEACLRTFAEEKNIKLKEIAQAIRVAISGKKVTPPLFEVMETLGKERVVERLKRWGIV
ncbi:MAG: Glutamate--tRNA ligase [bacterium 42_11]|nr:MAG: Glutamate--tRNA ligase [bacterium 42_11]